ncbi:AzlC family ABC transporter permease [Desulfonema magnum]|uniref:Branched-chain amino acid transport permease protein domain-containing protein n=1 Tax=Desulfonema magnum TaxID=45655 RepID=A0A975BUT5_9BACT|nr:AzlC family ABC transporter permease [Desulfonema magnum]QTA92033.1 Branched-chain amino acid transport permease protein domain-containing protein [Desulfonema magnum]
MNKTSSDTEKTSAMTQGLLAVWPICLGYIPIGLAFGVLAQKAGLGPLEIGLMSVFVFAGSSQFIAVSMVSAGAATASIIVTTFIVNLRHLLMSSSLSIFLKKVRREKLSLFAYGVTDESFAVNLSRFRHGDWNINAALVVNHAANLVWIASTVMGGYSGQFIPEGAFGIDYALIAMFICLLIYQLRARKYVIIAIIAGVLSVIFSLIIPGNSYIVLASVLAATIGVVFKKQIK